MNSIEKIKAELQRMDSYQFEKLIAAIWEIQGYKTTVRQASKDRGVDIEATMQSPIQQKLLIQAKRYKDSNKVDSQEVRNYATLYQQESNVDKVIIATSSTFTNEASKLARDLDVKTVDGEAITRKILENSNDDLLNNFDFNVSDEVVSDWNTISSKVEKATEPLLDENSPSGNSIIRFMTEYNSKFTIEVSNIDGNSENTDHTDMKFRIEPKISKKKLDNVVSCDIYENESGTTIEAKITNKDELLNIIRAVITDVKVDTNAFLASFEKN